MAEESRNTEGVKRVIYYIGEAGNGKKYPTNMVLYNLNLDGVTEGMTPEEKRAVYKKNFEIIDEKVQTLPSLKGSLLYDATGKYGEITLKGGETKKVKDVVAETLAQHPDNILYTQPKNIFFDYTCITALHRFFKEHPERKEEFFSNGNNSVRDVKRVFCDNFATSSDRMSPAEAMMLYQYLELTGGPDGVEKALKSYTEFRKKVIEEYFEPQVDHIFYLAKEKAKKSFLEPGHEDRIKYTEAIAKAENIHNRAYRDIGVVPPGGDNVISGFSSEKGVFRPANVGQNTGVEVKKVGIFLPDYKLKVADEMVKEDRKTGWKNKLPTLKAVNADAGEKTSSKGKSSKAGKTKGAESTEKAENAENTEKATENVSVFGGIFSSDDIKRLSSQIRLTNSAYPPEVDKIEVMKRKVLANRELRELLYRAGATEEAVKVLSEAGAGDDAKVFMKLRDLKKIPMPSEYQKAATTGFRRGETRAVIAVPGSGKTTSLIYTIESLLAEKKAKPGEITMISYTTGAAAEFRKRILERNPDLAGVGMHISTAHSLARSILRKYAPEVSLDILSEGEQKDLIENQVAPELAAKTGGDTALFKVNLANALKVIKLAPWSKKQMQEASAEYNYLPKHLEMALEIYNRKKGEMGKIDYDDLMINAMKVLETNEKARAEVQSHAQVLMVDEYQDTSPLQRAFEKLLLPEDGIKIEVGDDHQAIFTSLGARSDYLQSDAVEHKESYYILPTNYRSSSTLIEAFNDIKDTIEDSSRKNMFPAKGKNSEDSSEPKAKIEEFTDPGGEEAFIIRDIKKRLESGEEAKDIAILCRWNEDAKKIGDSIIADPDLGNLLLQDEKNPIIESFLKNPAAKTLRPVLESLAEPDNPELFNRMVETILQPEEKSSVYVGGENREKSPVDEFRKKAEEDDGNKPQKMAFLRAYEEALLKDDAREAVETFMARNCGYINAEEYRADNGYGTFTQKADYDNFMNELSIRKVARSEGLNFAMSMDEIGDSEKRVEKKAGLSIKTIHKAKGEEYETVYMYHQNEENINKFYTQIKDPEIRASHRIEEDKIAYTGITRAKTNLIVTGTAGKIAEIYNKISPDHVIRYKNGVEQESERVYYDSDLEFRNLQPKVETESRAKRLSRMR